MIIDCSTRWPKATLMKEASTTSCTEPLLSSWISCFRVPNSITMDKGPAFLSELWASLARLMGTKLHSTMAYHPAVNGMIERAHHSLKAALMACCTNENWNTQLPWVLLGLCTAPKADGDASPSEKVYGETLVMPGEFFPPSAGGADTPLPRLRELSRKFTPCHRTFTNRTSRYNPPASDSDTTHPALDSCAYVFVRVDVRWPPLTRPYREPPLTRTYRGPHRVIRQAPKAFLLDINGREDWVTIDKLKPAFLLDNEITEETGRRPRVPSQQHSAGTAAPTLKKGPGWPRKLPAPEPEVVPAPRP
ncbi:uncharacterized protein [Macrobrachium rosenbergii]|uniref:uncharacterized protein n=1 Tax=Macrobrachium rosenbergii TaxID=79674 RepID=UPI0034D6D2FE